MREKCVMYAALFFLFQSIPPSLFLVYVLSVIFIMHAQFIMIALISGNRRRLLTPLPYKLGNGTIHVCCLI